MGDLNFARKISYLARKGILYTKDTTPMSLYTRYPIVARALGL